MGYRKCEVNLQSRGTGPCGRTITEDYGECHLFDNEEFGDANHKIDIRPNGPLYQSLEKEPDEYLLKLANDTHGNVFQLCILHRVAMTMAELILANRAKKS